MAQLGIEFEVYNRKMELLDARRKTTQKGELVRKVEYPEQDAIRKIKRFMEDERTSPSRP